MEKHNAFIMDSGPFLDVIPIVLTYLDLRSRISLAQTCRFWKDRIYNDPKCWLESIELPYIGRMNSNNYTRNDPETVVKAQLWSMLLPPEDPHALENILSKMASSDESIQRFQSVEKVLFKNFIHTDESLRLTALLFPSIREISFEGDLLTIVGVQYIASSCRKLKHVEFYKCRNIPESEALRLFNTDDHKEHLERLFIYEDLFTRSEPQLKIEDNLLFMVLCQRCGLYFNQFNNDKERLCLYHSGTYDGYIGVCKSFNCCGSNVPRYPSTFGCQFTYHRKYPASSVYRIRYNDLYNGLPEYMFQKYRRDLFALSFLERRDLSQCYQKWNEQEQQKEHQ